MHIEICSYEAKTKLPELLRGVQVGNRYTITLRGAAVADLVPVQNKEHLNSALVVDEMRSLMRSRKPIAPIDLIELINEGRA